MPKLKASPGKVKFTTPVVDELQRYLFYELANAKQWNPEMIKHQPIGPNGWVFECLPMSPAHKWAIRFDGRAITVMSEQPKVYIRKGLTITMGNSRIIIEGS